MDQNAAIDSDNSSEDDMEYCVHTQKSRSRIHNLLHIFSNQTQTYRFPPNTALINSLRGMGWDLVSYFSISGPGSPGREGPKGHCADCARSNSSLVSVHRTL